MTDEILERRYLMASFKARVGQFVTDRFWEELFPAEQARIIQLLVERVDAGAHGLKIRLRVNGLSSIVQDLSGIGAKKRWAA